MQHGACRYVGRFAPSPTGLLHSGSLVAALASWLDARAHNGRWLVRVEDVDTPRCLPGAGPAILQQLAQCGLMSDGPVWYQSARSAAYQAALDELVLQQLAYPCTCTRKEIALALAASGHARARHAELRYPGTCRTRSPQPATPDTPPAWRMRTDFLSWKKSSSAQIYQEGIAPFFEDITANCNWHDRLAGWQQQHVEATVGDFVLKRADGVWAYQLAVVVDDAAQGITHVVRGLDLLDNTPRQLLLQRALGLPHPLYLHTPLVTGANGEKLSKQNGATPLDLGSPQAVLAALNTAAAVLGLPVQVGSPADALQHWVSAWAELLRQRADRPGGTG